MKHRFARNCQKKSHVVFRSRHGVLVGWRVSAKPLIGKCTKEALREEMTVFVIDDHGGSFQFYW